MADKDPVQDAATDLAHAVAKFYATQGSTGPGAPQQGGPPGAAPAPQLGAQPAQPLGGQPMPAPQGQPAPQPPAPTMQNQQAALHGQPPQPQQPAPQQAAPQAQPQYGAPSTQGQQGQLPPGFTMQTAPTGQTKYNGVFPAQGQAPTGQPQGDPQQQQMDAALKAMATPVTLSEAQAYMSHSGMDLSKPGVAAQAPRFQQFLMQQKQETSKAIIDMHAKAAQATEMQARATRATELAKHTGDREDIARATALNKQAQAYITAHPDEAAKPAEGGYLGSSVGATEAKPASKEYADAQNDIAGATKTFRGKSAGFQEAGPDDAGGLLPGEVPQKAPDGNSYIQRDGKYYKVEQ